jgi:Flp pilus assembly protein TadD
MLRPLLVAGLLLFAPALGGCASWEGARLYEQGTEALEAGDTERAIRDLEAAASRVPKAGDVYNNLGVAYLAAGRDDDARLAFERAVALDCSDPAAKQNLERLRAAATP